MSRWRLALRGLRRFGVLALPVAGGWLVAGNLKWWPAMQSWSLRVPAGIVLIVTAILLQVVVGMLEDRASSNTIAFRVAMKDALQPLVLAIAEMQHMTPTKRISQLSTVADNAAMSLATLWMPHIKSTRANIYRMEPDGKALRVIAYGGRGEKPGDFDYVKGPASQAALERVNANRVLIVKNMKKDPPKGFDGRPTDYLSFISVPIVDVDGYAYGMINIDAPAPRSFKDADRHAISVVASLLAIAFASAYPKKERVPRA